MEKEGWRRRQGWWGIGLGGVTRVAAARVAAARVAAARVAAARVAAARVAAARAVAALVAVVTVEWRAWWWPTCLRAFWLARRARPTRELYFSPDDSPELSRDWPSIRISSSETSPILVYRRRGLVVGRRGRAVAQYLFLLFWVAVGARAPATDPP